MTKRSYHALNATNFFLAQISAVVVPFLNIFLRKFEWRYDQIGLAMAVAGLGSLIFQIPVGLACDHLEEPRKLIFWNALLLGICYCLIPWLAFSAPWVILILFLSGIPGTFFAPSLGSLAHALGGEEKMKSILSENQSWSHAGAIVAGLVALMVIRAAGIQWLFYVAGLLAFLAATVTLMIEPKDLNVKIPAEQFEITVMPSFKEKIRILLKDTNIRTLLVSITLFYIANGAASSLVALYMKKLGSTDAQVAWIVLVAQPIMIPAAWMTGRLASRFGLKKMLTFVFCLFPVRLALYPLASTPMQVLAITALDGIVSGMFGVLLVLTSNELALRKKSFNTLMGLVQTAPALGAVIGTALQGALVQSYGFAYTFLIFASLAGIAAWVFSGKVTLPSLLKWHNSRN